MGTLKLYSAGAGSGKTHTLCDVVAAAIRQGTDPARILATTFTRKAAAELKGRIQARLLADATLSPPERLAKAERLELALIGTVHSIGLQLLARYALPLGLSPRLAVLEEAGSQQALRALLGQLDPAPWLSLASLMRRFGLGDAHDLVVDLLDAKRGNRIGDAAFQAQVQEAAERFCALMGPALPEAEAVSFEALSRLAGEALARIEGIRDTTATTRDAGVALRRLRDGAARASKDFIDAAQLAAGKRSGADEALAALRSAAATVLRQPGLQRDIRALLAGLGERTLALEGAYARYKQDRGLMDFTDLEVWLLRVLEDSRLTPSLRADIQLVVVDEFHDTNPLQLAIFQRLRDIAVHSVWVGDPKQSIYAFRGTDPTLFQALWASVPARDREPLPRNYRSQAGLVDAVNRLFGALWGTEAALEAAYPGRPRGLERWLLQGANVEQEAEALAAGILQLRREGTPLRDIAVLARTNEQARRLGAACRNHGVPALLELPGLLATREGALVLAGLRLVADRFDSLAAATILHLLGDAGEKTPGWLTARLEALRARERDLAQVEDARRAPEPPPFAGDPCLALLEAIDRTTLPPAVLVRRVIDALGVGERLAGWGQVAERAASLDGLVTLARAYEDEARGLGRTATLTGLITHLESLAESETDQAAPPYGIDAVTIVTYHASKGLEWETVVLSGLDTVPRPRIWDPDVRGGDPAGADALAGRMLRYWPWPFGAGGRSRNLPPQANLGQLVLDSAEGRQAGEEAAAEEARLLYVGCTRARRRLVFAHRPGRAAWLGVLPGVESLLPPSPDPGEHPIPGVRTTYVVRQLTAELADELAAPSSTESTWLASLRPAAGHPEILPRYWSPSLAPAEETSATAAVEELPGGPVFPTQGDAASETALGNAVHAYLTALPSLAALGREEKRRVAERCLRGFGAEALVSADHLVGMGERLRAWVAAKSPGAVWHTEVPVTAPRAGGGQWNGWIDLLLRLPDGSVVIIDHKGGPVRREQLAARAATYAGQLSAYREALVAQDLTVAAMWLHFPLAAAVVSLQMA